MATMLATMLSILNQMRLFSIRPPLGLYTTKRAINKGFIWDMTMTFCAWLFTMKKTSLRQARWEAISNFHLCYMTEFYFKFWNR